MGRYAIFNGLVYGGGTAVIPNPEGTPTDELHSLQIGDDIYEIVGGGGSGEGYSETLLYEATTPFQTGVITLNDNISNYDVLLFRTKFSDETRADLLLQVSLLQDVGYVASPSTNTKHALLLGFDSYYFRVVKGSETDDNIINIFAASGDQFIYEIYGIKIEGGSGSTDKVTKVYDAVPSGDGCSIVVAEHIWLRDSGGSVSYSTAEYPDITSVDNFIARLTQTAMDDGSSDYNTNITFTFDDTNKTIKMSWGTLSGSSGCYVDIVYSLVEPVVVASDVEISNTNTVTYDISSIIPTYQTLASKDFMFNLKHIYSDNDGLGTSSPFNINFNSNTGVLTVSWNDIGTNNILTGDILLLYKEDGYKLIRDMQPPTETSSGYHGYVPAPKVGDENKFLRGDGTWSEGGGSSNVEANPTGTPTDTLSTIGINGTIYDIEGSGGGDGYKLEKIFDGNVTTAGNITLTKSLDNYDELVFVMKQSSTYIRTDVIPIEFIKNIASYSTTHGVMIKDYSGYHRYFIVDYVDNTTLDITVIENTTLVEIYGVKLEGSSGGGSQELISYDTTITTTQYGWWTAEDKDGNTLDPDQYELIAVTPIVNNSSSWTGSWDGAFYINTVDGVTHRYDVTFVNINDGGYIRTSRTWDIKVVYRDKNAAGGGGGSTVVPNPQEEPTDTLNTVEIDGVVYNIEGGSEGEGVEIYSEDEYIVGKWIDGKKLYQKTYRFSTPITIPSSGWFTTNIPNSDKDTYVEVIGISPSKTLWNFLGATGDTGNYVNILNPRSTDIQCESITLRYTKTVETPAPAWGGSVTNNYANFIDTSNVIDSGVYNPTTPLSYTAAEDCFMVIVLIASNNPCIVSVDNKEIYRLYDNGVSSITAPIPLKKGQTITATTSYSAEDSPYTVYGITYASGGSDSGSSKIEYSTEEHKIGTYFGEDLYEKSFIVSNLIIGSDWNFDVLGTSNIEIIDFSGFCEMLINGTNDKQRFNINYYDSSNAYCKTLIDRGLDDLAIQIYSNAHSFVKACVTIRYTKTTT